MPSDQRDVVRHPLVQRIVKAYEEYEQKQEQKNPTLETERNEEQDETIFRG